MAKVKMDIASERIVDETRRLYLGLIEKPLDSRQLAKPQFKFILDLVLSVSICSILFMACLLSRDESPVYCLCKLQI